jgi:hypothetical protein
VLATCVGNKTQGSALNSAHFTNRASGSFAFTPHTPQGSRESESCKVQNFARLVGGRTKQMKTRVIIEYDLPPGDHVAQREREEQRWITCETVLALPGSATVKVELVDRLEGRLLLPAM